METPFERKLKANVLRKSGNYQEALVLYKELHQENADKFTYAGYLHCLRKLKQFNEAIPLANSLVGKFPGFDWVTTEIIWTYIEGMLNPIPEEESLSTTISVANKILQLQPNQIASNVVNMRVCKAAKHEKNWKLLDEWVRKIDPDSLDSKPMQLPNGREGWSQQGLWYLYKINALVENGMSDEVFPFLEYTLEHFPKHKKFFLRLRALAYSNSGRKEDAATDYKILCDVQHPDWWMLKEYADVLNDLGRKDEALEIMLFAAQARQDPGLMVVLFEAIGDLFYERDSKENAALHYQLTKLIREDKSWKVPDSLNDKLSGLSTEGFTISLSLEEVFQKCQAIWKHGTEKPGAVLSLQSSHKDMTKINAHGKISLGRSDRPFCFINLDDGDSVFCFKDMLPLGINDGDIVIVDARPSWDQKKNKQSWKAQNIRLQKC
jgi:tetratricopeptide (TPR) repeat protein